MVCPRCDTIFFRGLRLFKIIKAAYCRNCGSIWHASLNGNGEIIGWEIEIDDEEWKRFKAQRREELRQVNEELSRRDIKNESICCGEDDE